MKTTHINLLRAAANLLQSSIIMDEQIADHKFKLSKALRDKNPADYWKIKGLEYGIEFSKDRNKKFLQQYAEVIQQLVETDFTKLLAESFDNAKDITDTIEGKAAIDMANKLTNSIFGNVKT